VYCKQDFADGTVTAERHTEHLLKDDVSVCQNWGSSGLAVEDGCSTTASESQIPTTLCARSGQKGEELFWAF
jgi:hypothetical protein